MRIALALLSCVAAACTVRPAGEQRERDRAAEAGRAYAQPFAARELPPLEAASPLSAWHAHAEVANGELEAAWHRWIASLEQVPQAATQDTTAMVGLEHRFDGGSALDRSAVMLMSDAMANLLLPGRLEARGEAALAAARVEAARFDRLRLALHRRIAEAYWALAQRDAEIRLLRELRGVRAMQAAAAGAAVAGGRATQLRQLAAEIAEARLDAEITSLEAGRPALAAALRALVGAGPAVPDPAPALAAVEPLADGERDWLEQALRANPDLAVARAEHAAASAEVAEREWMRVPEFSLRGLLMGDGAATIAGAVTLPFLRGTAIEASVRQAEAAVRAAEAMRRQAGAGAVAAVLAETASLEAIAAERELLAGGVLPRLRQAAAIARAGWSAGGGAIDDWAEAEAMRTEIALRIARLDAAGLTARARLAEAVGGLPAGER